MSSINFPTSVSLCPQALSQSVCSTGETKIIGKKLKDRTITTLSMWDQKLDSILPNFFFQTKLDEIGRLILQKFEPLKKFNQWLDSNGHGAWHQKLATFLLKLPMRAILNIIQLLYSIIREILYASVHPLKATTRAAKMLTELVFELTRPEVWSKIGATIVGTSAGQAAVLTNPLAIISVAVGGALILAGITVGPIRAALDAQSNHRFDAAKQNIYLQATQAPEAILTGFLLGLMIGGIQRVVKQHQKHTHDQKPALKTTQKHYTQEEIEKQFLPSETINAKVAAEKAVLQFIQENDLPATTKWSYDTSTGKIWIDIPWQGEKLKELTKAYPAGPTTSYYGIKIELSPWKDPSAHIYGEVALIDDGIEFYDYTRQIPADTLGKLPQLPHCPSCTPPIDDLLAKYGLS